MPIAADFSVATNGDIRWTGTTGAYTTLELHRWLQDMADDASATGDDLVYIATWNPSNAVPAAGIITLIDHSAVGGPTFNIDATAAQHLYGGSISQEGGDTVYSGLAIIGEFTAEPSVVQNNAFLTPYWGTSRNPNPATGVAIRILVQTVASGVQIDGGRIRVQTRDFGNQYREASTVLGVGEGPAAVGSIQPDPFNATAIGTIAALVGITNTEGYQQLTINAGTGLQPFYSQWSKGANTQAQLYEYIKWATRDGSAQTLYGLDGDLFRGVTHEINIDTPTGNFDAVEPVSWAGGTGQMLAIDSETAGTKMWIQLLTGVVPTDGQTITGGTSGATADVNVTVAARALGVESVVGNFTGAFLGARGVGFVPSDLTVADGLTDLLGVSVNPPNQQSFTVSGLNVGATRVLVGPQLSGTTINTAQLTADGAQLAAATTFVVNEAIPADTPPSGTFRVSDGTQFRRVAYTSWAGSTFTLTTTLGHNVADNANAWISYIDVLAGSTSESFTSIYSADRGLVVLAREASTPGSEKVEFRAQATFGSAGGSIGVILGDDSG